MEQASCRLCLWAFSSETPNGGLGHALSSGMFLTNKHSPLTSLESNVASYVFAF